MTERAALRSSTFCPAGVLSMLHALGAACGDSRDWAARTSLQEQVLATYRAAEHRLRTGIPGYAPTAWIPHREFEAGDVVTWTMDPCQGPLYRLITAVRVGPPEVDPDLDDQDMSPVRTYTWEHLDRGIRHGHQRRDDDDYQSEWSTDPQMWHWRRVLRGAQRGEP